MEIYRAGDVVRRRLQLFFPVCGVGFLSPERVESVKMPYPAYILALLFTVCFTLATSLQPLSLKLNASGQSDSMLAVLLGDGRRMFANHFFTKADVYFHSGYYPSLFQQSYAKVAQDRHMVEGGEDHDSAEEEAKHEKAMDFLGAPQNWVDSFGRHFLFLNAFALGQTWRSAGDFALAANRGRFRSAKN